MELTGRQPALETATGRGLERPSGRRLPRRVGVTALSISLSFVAWAIVATFFNPILLPGPAQVATTWWGMVGSGEYWEDVWITVVRVLVGFAGGASLGIALGLLMGRIASVRDFVDPEVQFLRALPPIAIIPLVIIWFGLDEVAKYVVVGYGAFFIVLVNTIDGVLRMPRIRERAARSLGARDHQIFLNLVIPSAMPYILTGMRVAIGVSFMSVVAAEMIAADSGVGFLVMESRLLIQTDRVFVGLFTLGLLGYLGDRLFALLMRKLAGRYVEHLEHAA